MSEGVLILESTAGNLNLSQYLNVQEGDGMDPADPSFTEKVFAHSLLKQGGTLALENFKLREQVYPLLLKATTKNALTALVREINTIINTAGCVASWQDAGATEPTYFQLSSAQLDPEFNYRRGEYNWLDGKLRLFVQPFGLLTATPRKLLVGGTTTSTATMIGTAPVLIFRASGVPAGDAPTLLQGLFGVPSFTAGATMYQAVSVLPTPSYTPQWPVASYSSDRSSPAGSSIATTNAMAGNYKHYASNTAISLTWQIAAGDSRVYSYIGNQRVLLVARVPSSAGASVYAAGMRLYSLPYEGTEPISTATITSREWSLVDMGVLGVPSTPLLPEAPMTLSVSSYSSGQGGVDIAGLILLPDKSTTWGNNGLGRPALYCDGVSNHVLVLEGENSQDWTSVMRGAIPQIPLSNNAPVLAFLSVPVGSPTTKTLPLNYELCAAADVLERTRYVF